MVQEELAGKENKPEKQEKPLKEKRADSEIKSAEKIQKKSLDEKRADLEKLEKDIDKKRADLRKLISEAEHHGKSQTGGSGDKEEDAKRSANEYLKGTGLVPYPEVE